MTQIKNLKDLRIIREYDSIAIFDDSNNSEFLYAGRYDELERTMKLLKWLGLRVDTDVVEDYRNEAKQKATRIKR